MKSVCCFLWFANCIIKINYVVLTLYVGMNFETIMQNITLTQFSIITMAVCMVSFLVNANDFKEGKVQNKVILTANSASINNNNATGFDSDNAKSVPTKFIFSAVDKNNNGELSYQEVLLTDSQWLLSSFKAIDSNINNSITEKEIVDFAYKPLKIDSFK